ncbi:MAG TPA: amino acid permease, partial [Mycobacteriales bacterium]|nr:amino acid permease [Mycobacteriales bacterium]
NGVARYFFALGRERVLPSWLGRIGSRSGGPVAGSMTQTGLALVVVLIFAASHSDPLLQLFTWFSGISAVGVILLMTGTSASVIGFFRRRKDEATTWQRVIAPALATVILAALVVLLVTNFDALLGPADADGPLRWIFPALPFAAALLGLIWAHVLKVGKADIFSGIGRSGLTTAASEPEQDKEFVLPRLRQ